jgi:hypothetical protein
MEKDNVFKIMEFIEDVKDRLNNIEYKNIMDILQSSYKVTEQKRNLYDVKYRILQAIETKGPDDYKDLFYNNIESTCLVRLKDEEYEILKAISRKDHLDILIEDIDSIYTILYLINNVNFFNIYDMDVYILDDTKKRIFYKLKPIIISVKKAKNIDGDLYKFSFYYRYDKISNDLNEDTEIDTYKDCLLHVSITKNLNREDFIFIENNINDMGLKLLLENYEDISFKIENDDGEIIKTKDELFNNIQFSYIEYKPFVEYNNERYYLHLFDLKSE